MLYVCVAAACMTSDDQTPTATAHESSLSVVTRRGAPFEKAPGAKNRTGDVSVSPRMRDARADANAEAGSSAEMASGG